MKQRAFEESSSPAKHGSALRRKTISARGVSYKPRGKDAVARGVKADIIDLETIGFREENSGGENRFGAGKRKRQRRVISGFFWARTGGGEEPGIRDQNGRGVKEGTGILKKRIRARTKKNPPCGEKADRG